MYVIWVVTLAYTGMTGFRGGCPPFKHGQAPPRPGERQVFDLCNSRVDSLAVEAQFSSLATRNPMLPARCLISPPHRYAERA